MRVAFFGGPPNFGRLYTRKAAVDNVKPARLPTWSVRRGMLVMLPRRSMDVLEALEGGYGRLEGMDAAGQDWMHSDDLLGLTRIWTRSLVR